MSAIWGIIKKQDCNHIELLKKMTETMHQYKIDRFDEKTTDNAAFGCGHQYITPESQNDVSPICENKILFSGDCFLYNREYIIDRIYKSHTVFFKSSPDLNSLGDTELAYYLFKIEGYRFVTHLRGSFAFAIYDENEKQLHLYTDHFVKRYLCYYICDDYVCFSSVYKPIMAIASSNLSISRRFIVRSYMKLSQLNFTEPETTIFNEVKHLDAAMHYTIDITSGSVSKEQYWNPRKTVKKLKVKNFDDYKSIFLETFKRVTYSELRALKETGIMLSGGLDSSAVLSLSAPYLKNKNKSIYSYTTVPSSNYEAEISYNIIENESFLIKEQQKYHSNLQPRFISSDSYNCISTLERFQELFDIPVKASINNANITHMLDAATLDNCSIVLSGSNGNPTISYGSIGGYVDISLRHGHIKRAIHEANCYCLNNKISRLKFLLDYIKSKAAYVLYTRKDEFNFLKHDDYEEHDVKNFRKKEKHEYGDECNLTERQKRNYMFIPKQYIQKGYYYTVLGLEYGFLQIDPTLTVEIVELSMALPDECFVHDGIERYLVRGFMKDLIPPIITDPRKGYGVQASDFDFRINEDWPDIKDETISILSDPSMSEYLDTDSIEYLLNDIKEHDKHIERGTCWSMTLIAALGYYLRGHREYIKK